MGISVVIICYNSSKVIKETLEHLQRQVDHEKTDWEIVFVDNNSTDGTVELAQEIWAENPIAPMRIINEKEQGESVARRTGALHAKYEIISFIDDDNYVFPGWIKTVHQLFENKEIGIIGCAGEGLFESEPPVWFKEFEHHFAIGKLVDGSLVDITDIVTPPTAGLSIRTEILQTLYRQNYNLFLQGRVGNRQTAGADSEICQITRLLGYKIFYTDRLKFKHFTTDARISWERLKKMNAGFGASDVFIMAYTLVYKEKTNGKLGFIDRWRKFWWFNKIGKILVQLTKDPLAMSGFGKGTEREIAYIRNKAFRTEISRRKQDFKEFFDYVKKTIPEIKEKLSN